VLSVQHAAAPSAAMRREFCVVIRKKK